MPSLHPSLPHMFCEMARPPFEGLTRRDCTEYGPEAGRSLRHGDVKGRPSVRKDAIHQGKEWQGACDMLQKQCPLKRKLP